MIRRISLTTDFSMEGQAAFYTALALAIRHRSRLDILHVSGTDQEAEWDRFPRVRQVLERWKLLPAGSRVEDVQPILGVDINKVEIFGSNITKAITDFVTRHTPDLMVAASHGRRGVSRWLEGSVAMQAMRGTALPSLLIGPSAKPIVDVETGALNLKTVLIPIADVPSPQRAIAAFHRLLSPHAPDVHYIHVIEPGVSMEAVRNHVPQTRFLEGDVVSTILDAADGMLADVIVMITARHKSLIDLLRGSTTERVLREARAPILVLPG